MGTFSISTRRLCFLLCLTTVVVVPSAHAQRAGNKEGEGIGFQTWKDPSGKFKIDARLVEQSESKIILEDKTKRHRTVEKKRIDSAQINPVHLAWLRKQDAAQYALVRSLVGNSTSTSQGLVLGDPEPYLAAHRNYPSAPYAGIVAAIALSMEKNNFEAAIRTLRDVVDRCENHRAFDENAHRLTLAAALNNLAICLLKDGKGNAGVSSLQQAAKHLKSIPRELVHNAKVVQKIGTENTIISITKKQMSDMSLAIANVSAAESDSHEHPYFQYGLFWDLPRHPFASDVPPWSPSQVPNDRGQFPGQPYQGPKRYISFASGYGFGVASNWVVTNAHFFRGPFWGPSEIAVRLQSLASGKSLSVNTADLQFAPDESGLDLVLIKVSEPISKPISLTASDPSVGAELMVVDFPSGGFDGAEFTLKRGKVLSPATRLLDGDQETFAVVHDAVVSPRFSGAPAMDDFGNATGVILCRPEEYYGTTWGLLVPQTSARTWVEQIVGSASLPVTESVRKLSAPQEVRDQLRQSLFKIDLWIDAGVAPGAREFGANQDNHPPLYDHWCFLCKGVGHLSCPNRACKRGRIFNKVKVQTGVDPNTGTPLFGEDVVYTPCPVCDAIGKVDCGACDKGRF